MYLSFDMQRCLTKNNKIIRKNFYARLNNEKKIKAFLLPKGKFCELLLKN